MVAVALTDPLRLRFLSTIMSALLPVIWPAVKSPCWHVTVVRFLRVVAVQLPALVYTFVISRFPDKTSLDTALVAVAGPLFVTCA
jgi:hypothetical protein